MVDGVDMERGSAVAGGRGYFLKVLYFINLNLLLLKNRDNSLESPLMSLVSHKNSCEKAVKNVFRRL